MQVRRQLLGEDPLPWEAPRLTVEARGKLGAFKTPVLAMLARDPTRRASCQQLAGAVHDVLLTTSTSAPRPEPRRSRERRRSREMATPAPPA